MPGEGAEPTWNGEQKEIDIVTFASSSTVRNFIKILGPENIVLLKDVKIACIGPVTARTAEELGLDVAVTAKDYTIDGLIKAILQEEALKD